MKRLVILLACVSALALPAASLADTKPGADVFRAHLARAQANVAKVVAKCKVAQPAPRCTDALAAIQARLDAWQARLLARIARLEQQPASARRTAGLTVLNARLARIAALEARL